MNALFANNQNLRECSEVLVRLHMAIAAGDKEIARQIREELDVLAACLNDEEDDWLGGLSGDLYMLQSKEVFEPADRSPKELRDAIIEAQQHKDGEAMLKLLRQAFFVTKGNLAHFRANAYALLGYPQLSLLFRRFAADQFAGDKDYQRSFLGQLWLLGEISQARQIALSFLDNNKSSPVERIFSAGVLYSCTKNISYSEAMPLIRKVIDVLHPLLDTPQLAARVSKRDLAHGYVVLAACRDYLGEKEDALKCYDASLALDPKQDAVLVARGLLLENTNPKAAYSDFEQAVRIKTKLNLPYLIVAREALKANDITCGLKMSKKVYSIAANDRVRSVASQFIAICYYEQGKPLDDVIAKFDYALRLDPLNNIAAQNRSIVLEDAKARGIKPQKIHSNPLTQIVFPSLSEERQESIVASFTSYIDDTARRSKEDRDLALAA